MSLAELLNQLSRDDELSATDALVMITNWLRPARGETSDDVAGRIASLEQALLDNLDLHHSLSGKLQEWLNSARFFQLLASLGLFSRKGFLKEFGERIYERINPAPADPDSVKDVFTLVFSKRSDTEWVMEVPGSAWFSLFRTLWRFSPSAASQATDKICFDVLYATELLSIWIAAEELEPGILRLDPRIVEKDSAFVALQRELAVYARHYRAWMESERNPDEFYDDAHVRVLLEQCEDEIERLRKLAVTRGSSIGLTHLLERLNQTLERIGNLLDVLHPYDQKQRIEQAVMLFRKLVQANAERHSVSALWQQNIKLVSRSVTENSSDRGDHYIAGSRHEYFHMLASGLGGGVVIALMALLKIQILQLGFERFTETVLVSLNYGLGFMFIHIIHCTVATKQPAMTAANIAAKVEQGEHGRANARMLAELLVKVGRTQFVAIVGNVAAAVAVAMLVGWLYLQLNGLPLLSSARYDYILNGIHPWQSLALVYAAIAGVWLFLSGLVAGFFDNRADYINLSGRLEVHPLLKRLLPDQTRIRLARYLHDNYGALTSNFVFGVLLGTTGYIGYLLNLPIDIRHVAFSSADVGYAMSVFNPGPAAFAAFVGFALLIGLVNLVISFTLALNVALRARGAKITRPDQLFRAWVEVVRERPIGLLYPPREPIPEHPADPEKPPAAGKEH